MVAQQVAAVLDHKVVIGLTSKGLEPNSHKRLSTILEEEIPERAPQKLWLYLVLVTRKTIVRDITLITAASKDLETAQYVQALL